MLTNNNPILDTDSYKFSHPLQYPENTDYLMAYIEARGGPDSSHQTTTFFGLQMILEQLTVRITKEHVEEAKAFCDVHLGQNIFPYDDWMYVVNSLDGKIPLKIKAVPEGTKVPVHNVLVTIESTDTRCFWMVSWFETQLLRVWYPTNVATISNAIKKIIYTALINTSDDADGAINFKLHDFGSRGVSSRESAALGGAAHLANFMGSDTVVGVIAANKYYQASMAGFSIPAAEHSTITTWGKTKEAEAFRMMLNKFHTPLVAVVSDSYDLHHAVTEIWGTELKQEVIDSGKMVVVRPDSGSPIEQIVLQTIEGLANKFGTTENSKGFKVLNNVRVIQGDGINETTIAEIINLLIQNQYSIDNIAFGMGGALLQQYNRDTYKFAYKACLARINGEYRRVFKDPATDPGKRSKSGKLTLVNSVYGGITTVDILNRQIMTIEKEMLETVFENGEMVKQYTLDEVRSTIDTTMKLKECPYNPDIVLSPNPRAKENV